MSGIDEMTDLAMWSLLLGAVLPPLVSLIKRNKWSDGLKSLFSVLIFVFAGVGTAYFSGNFNGRSVVSSFLVIAVTGYSLYQNFYKPVGVDKTLSNATESNRN